VDHSGICILFIPATFILLVPAVFYSLYTAALEHATRGDSVLHFIRAVPYLLFGYIFIATLRYAWLYFLLARICWHFRCSQVLLLLLFDNLSVLFCLIDHVVSLYHYIWNCTCCCSFHGGVLPFRAGTALFVRSVRCDPHLPSPITDFTVVLRVYLISWLFLLCRSRCVTLPLVTRYACSSDRCIRSSALPPSRYLSRCSFILHRFVHTCSY